MYTNWVEVSQLAGQGSAQQSAYLRNKEHNKTATKQGKLHLIKTVLMSDKIRLTCWARRILHQRTERPWGGTATYSTPEERGSDEIAAKRYVSSRQGWDVWTEIDIWLRLRGELRIFVSLETTKWRVACWVVIPYLVLCTWGGNGGCVRMPAVLRAGRRCSFSLWFLTVEFLTPSSWKQVSSRPFVNLKEKKTAFFFVI